MKTADLSNPKDSISRASWLITSCPGTKAETRDLCHMYISVPSEGHVNYGTYLPIQCRHLSLSDCLRHVRVGATRTGTEPLTVEHGILLGYLQQLTWNDGELDGELDERSCVLSSFRTLGK